VYTRLRSVKNRPFAAMDNYRLFVYRDGGQLVGSAVIIDAANDDEAIAQAEFGRCWRYSGHRGALAPEGSVACDPQRTRRGYSVC
jgi:hypothetical protein